MSAGASEFDLAVVGLSCRFPGAANPAAFWRNLLAGTESITRFSPAELAAAGIPSELVERDDYVPAAPVLEHPDRFDAAFFGYQPTEAAALDPQHRLLLELAHEALEDAACNPEHSGGRRIAVFAGAALNSYFVDRGQAASLFGHYIPTLLAADKDFLATRVSYKLGLTGPSLTVQSACSTGLVAVHLARQSLLSEECDLALAAAVSVRVPHRAGYLYDGSGVVSADGRVRPFGAGANGTVFGSGGGVVALRRLEDAIARGDRIYAVVKGSAINNDGAEKAGYSAPSVRGQADAVVEALANAGLTADEISYLEAHGSGTPIGDRIEALALTQAFRQFTQRRGFCALGSVKGNVGHLDAAAGLAGLIKTILALHHQRIPATLHADEPNPEIDFAASPFRLATTSEAWPRVEGLRRAGVMATGMGGTNAHVVLEEAPLLEPAVRPAAEPALFVLSARTPAALAEASLRFGAWVGTEGESAAASPAEVAGTLQRGRRAFAFRRAAVADSTAAAAALLAAGADDGGIAGEATGANPPAVVYLLPGVGDQYEGMGRGLYRRFGTFRQAIDEGSALFAPALGCDLRELLYPAGGDTAPAAAPVDLRRLLARGEDRSPPAEGPLLRTRFSQPLLFLFEYALARLWQSAGVAPTRLVTHSLGEWVAACLAGVFSLPDAVRLVSLRARLVDGLPVAALAAVMLSEDELRVLLPPGIWISLVNGPRLCVVAGAPAPMEAFRRQLQSRGVVHRTVRGAHPFHTPLLEPIAGEFRAALRLTRLKKPSIPFTSNVTGRWITDDEATDPEYWLRHACSPARFSGALECLWSLPDPVLVEVGPGRTLGVLALQHSARGARKPLCVPTVRAEYEGRADDAVFLESAARLWVRGLPLNWEAFPLTPHRTVSLPTYPFQRESCWLASTGRAMEPKPDPAGWFCLPRWERAPRQPPPAGEVRPEQPLLWVLITRDKAEGRMALHVKAQLEKEGATVQCLAAGSNWSSALIPWRGSLRRGDVRIVYFAESAPPMEGTDAAAPAVLETFFHDPLRLAQSLTEAAPGAELRMLYVTGCGHDVTGREALVPAAAMAGGWVPVLRREYPSLRATALDVDEAAFVETVLAEARAPDGPALVAVRGRHRWVRCWRPQPLASLSAGASGTDRLRQGGVYVITGGAGGIGLEVARFLARSYRARIVLASRGAIAAEAARRELEKAGGTVELASVDVVDPDAVRRLFDEVRRRHGAVHGVFHAAGIQHDGMLARKNDRDRAEVLAPKVAGTVSLFAAIGDHPLDFVVLFSSLSSLLGYHGQVDYAAANAFLDATAASASARRAFPTFAINWPVWSGVGMAARTGAGPRAGISAAEGIDALRRILASGLVQVAVSPLPWDQAEAEAASVLPPAPVAAAGPASAGAGADDPPQDEVERAVHDFWHEALGNGPRGRQEDFIAAGGHSLLAMRIVAQIRATYGIDFTLRQFFATPTVAGNAAAIQEAVLAQVESLSEEEVGRQSA